MRTETENIRIIGDTNSIDELNSAYNALVLSMNDLCFDGISTRSGVESTLNHLTNYNIVRIANKAADDYESSGCSDLTRLIEISVCRDSLKNHEDMATEQELLDNLCDILHIH